MKKKNDIKITLLLMKLNSLHKILNSRFVVKKMVRKKDLPKIIIEWLKLIITSIKIVYFNVISQHHYTDSNEFSKKTYYNKILR